MFPMQDDHITHGEDYRFPRKDKGSSLRKENKILYLLSIENDSIITRRTLVNDLDGLITDDDDESLLTAYEKDLLDLEKNLHWKNEEGRLISHLALKGGEKG